MLDSSTVLFGFQSELSKIANGDMLAFLRDNPDKAEAREERLKAKEKKAFSESRFSGGTGPGKFNLYASRIPPFRAPPVKTSEKQAAIVSPSGQLSKAQAVGQPAATPPGPSIAQQSKPIGFGRSLPGAKKGNDII